MRRPERVLPIALAALALGACVHQGPPGVKVQALQADIVFGVKQAAQNTAPPLSVAPVPQALPPEQQAEAPIPPDTPFKKQLQGPIQASMKCPLAAADAFPQKAAHEGVEGQPAVGIYQWKQSGTYFFGTQQLPLGGYQTRAILSVSKPVTTTYPADPNNPTAPKTTTTFTYLEMRSVPSGGYVVRQFQVKSGALSANQPITIPAVGYISNAQTGEADRGVSLLAEIQLDNNFKVGATRTYNPPVLLLPLDVVEGQQYQSVGVSQENGATLTHTATVQKRQMVDACGDEVDGWRVEAQESYSDPQKNTTLVSSYTYIVATQLGGILIYEHTSPAPPNFVPPNSPIGAVPVPAQVPNPQAALSSAPTPDIQFSLAQLNPSPFAGPGGPSGI